MQEDVIAGPRRHEQVAPVEDPVIELEGQGSLPPVQRPGVAVEWKLGAGRTEPEIVRGAGEPQGRPAGRFEEDPGVPAFLGVQDRLGDLARAPFLVVQDMIIARKRQPAEEDPGRGDGAVAQRAEAFFMKIVVVRGDVRERKDDRPAEEPEGLDLRGDRGNGIGHGPVLRGPVEDVGVVADVRGEEGRHDLDRPHQESPPGLDAFVVVIEGHVRLSGQTAGRDGEAQGQGQGSVFSHRRTGARPAAGPRRGGG